MRKTLVTAALPYANGPIHIGHMVEYIQADVWVRLQRLSGQHCLYISGSDAHGTSIMLSAQQRGISPETLINQFQQQHRQDFNDFAISFDNFYTTHSSENQALVEQMYHRLEQNGDIFTREVTQAFDGQQQMFLPDRYVKGVCPRCHAPDQYGDNCEQCGAVYSTADLLDAFSVISDTKPLYKKSLHYFFDLAKYQDFLQQWLQGGVLSTPVTNKLMEWFASGLKAWDVSRDAPYFGFLIPGATQKYFYVWLDAPIGYMASLKNLANRDSTIDFDEYWSADSDVSLHHFIGKDIINFHALFWPALLRSSGLRQPNRISVHGYMTINQQKMSKSRGTFITARAYLNQLSPTYLRYYLCAKLSAQVEDIDFNIDDFRQRVNSDLVGKYVNLASRCAGFITKLSAGQLADHLAEPGLWQHCVDQQQRIFDLYQQLDYHKALRQIMALADEANRYIDQQEPWVLAKQPDQLKKVQAICTQGINLFKVLSIYLKPVVPELVKKVEVFLNCPPWIWQDIHQPLLNHRINRFTPLLQRVTPEQCAAIMSA